ncbi:PadR family transcriptional regulator [Companilactobacillus metriopterae]|uniref:PadR family transcriptional regulator n=1 Tax=Companilactobacillus metriopterae TaxID=1909267 RepID=UPI00100BC9CD|nr:PadR family transcriptional regulator [Companilactobacillus metriopterae]
MPKKRILPFVILGLINNEEQLTGYQISQEFKNEIGEFWYASHSQIYPELQRMLDDNWITSIDDKNDSRRTFYKITSDGESNLLNWLKEPVNDQNDELTPLKMFFIKDGKSPILKSLIEQDLEVHQKKLDHLQERLKSIFSDDQMISDNYGHYLVLTRAIEREANHLKWNKTNLKKFS